MYGCIEFDNRQAEDVYIKSGVILCLFIALVQSRNLHLNVLTNSHFKILK